MKIFAELITRLDQSNKSGDKLEALHVFFKEASEEDILWAVALFLHRKPKRQVSTQQLRRWCQEKAGIPDWLFEESYTAVGDLAETISLLLPPPTGTNSLSLSYWITFLQELDQQEEEAKKTALLTAWEQLNPAERFVLNKLVTGGFRVSINQGLVSQALAKRLAIPTSQAAHRLMGSWDPTTISLQELLLPGDSPEEYSKPFPFFMAHPVEPNFQEVFQASDWLSEWKWDGIRVQLIRRGQQSFIWSQEEELVNDKFPEILALLDQLPDGTVLDGELLAFLDGAPLPFSILQTRMGRKSLSKKQQEDAPVSFMAFDLLEGEGKDLRNLPLVQRKALLTTLLEACAHPALELSEPIPFTTWEALELQRTQAREQSAEGLMLKKKDSIYETDSELGSWWKWTIDPLTINGVLIYAQKGQGKRVDLFSEFTFGVWDVGLLVSFTKSSSGLTDAEIREIDTYVKKNTEEKFGPVRTVTPGLVFEIAFEGIQASSRHKSGIALRNPHITRWWKDKTIAEANSLADLHALLR